VGAVAPLDIVIPKGMTTQDAQKTSFFQALNIPTKITKGNIEIISDVSGSLHRRFPLFRPAGAGL
jgi:large subunit ribosomal protein LP0